MVECQGPGPEAHDSGRYTDYIVKDLVPALGAIRLEQLHHRHIAQFVRDQLVAGRGRVTLRRCVATLSSALTDAVRQHRLTHNAARYTAVVRPPLVERVCWTAREAAVFLRYCVDVEDPLAELYEVIMGTGMRRGEALALHWADVRLEDRVLFVRYTLSNVDNSRPVFSAPKTRSSYAWIALSDRVMAALLRQRDRQRIQRLTAGGAYEDRDLVFTRRDGQPLRPEYVLRHFPKTVSAPPPVILPRQRSPSRRPNLSGGHCYGNHVNGRCGSAIWWRSTKISVSWSRLPIGAGEVGRRYWSPNRE